MCRKILCLPKHLSREMDPVVGIGVVVSGLKYSCIILDFADQLEGDSA